MTLKEEYEKDCNDLIQKGRDIERREIKEMIEKKIMTLNDYDFNIWLIEFLMDSKNIEELKQKLGEKTG
jgi:hypothetical protein